MGADTTVPSGSADGLTRRKPTATVQAWVLPHLLAHVASTGHDPSPLRRIAGIRGRNLDDPDLRVADSAAAEAWHLAESIVGDETLGLHMAQAIPPGALDLLEYAFRASPTLDVALRQLARYGRVVADRTAATVGVEGDAVALTIGSHPQRHRIEFALALVVRLAREATGTAVAPREVRFVHGPPASLFEHRAFFRAPLRYHEPSNQLLFAKADTARPLRSADAALASVVRRRLDKMLAQIPRPDESTEARVRRALLDTLARGETTALAIGRELGMSERTIHRRLRAEGATFRGILDAIREELATALLREPGIGIAEIAFFLGYSEPAAFHRSFRRWTGRTPLAFRQASQSA